jgi:protein-S-isoprenylcysteine O-methyltransferase Ste14
MSLTARVILAAASTGVYLGLAVVAYGGYARFFSHPPLVALAAIFVVLTVAAIFAGGNVSAGVREDRTNRWVVGAVLAIGLFGAVVPAWTDRIGFWTIDGDTTRWIGVALLAIGGTLRIVPVFVLGNRFSGLVAIQPDHALATGGIYGVIRHPSYLGLLVSSLGWGLAFRSTVGVLLAGLLIPVIVARIRAEERLLSEQFGPQYDAYRARTSRLIPGIY